MKHYLSILLFLLTSLTVSAQEQKKFSPEKFDAELEEYITREANLDGQEASRLFPLMREMHNKQRSVYQRMRKLGKTKPADDAGCEEAIRELDKCNLELKQLEQCYHKKMLQVVSASKLYDVIKAEMHFHRKMMKGWQQKNSHSNGKQKDKRR